MLAARLRLEVKDSERANPLYPLMPEPKRPGDVQATERLDEGRQAEFKWWSRDHAA
jgi:hypothetical protein